jgi:rod shape-determining protein MreC
MGDNSQTPILDFIEAREDVNPGDRIVTSGDGGVFPPGLLVGQVIATTDGRLRARLAADLVRLQFLRVMRSHPGTSLDDPGDLIGPPWPFTEDAAEVAPEEADPIDETRLDNSSAGEP